MALSRPFAYNDTGSPISGTTQYGDLVVGDIEAPYGANYGGVVWWGGPDEDLRYAIGNSRPGGQPVPSGVTETAYVGFWGTELGDKTSESFLNLANYIGALNNQPPFANATQASIWLTNNGYWNSYRTWSAGGPLITGRLFLAGAGTQNAGLAIGGDCLGPLSCTEEYNGSSWTAGGALITGRCNLAGAGTQNAGLAFGGFRCFDVISCTEEYDGSSWSAGGALITARCGLAGAGTQNAGLAFGGNPPGLGNLSCTEEYNGSSWSTGGSLITARKDSGRAGTQNAGLTFGGQSPTSPFVAASSEEYNGTSWSAGGSLSSPRYGLGSAVTQNSGLAFGGGSVPAGPGQRACTEVYNGSSWSTVDNLITARSYLAGAGTESAGLAFGGFAGNVKTCTEEYS